MTFDNSNLSLPEIEKLEHKYLMKYWYFLKFVEDEIVKGIRSMEDIRGDWEGLYGSQKGGTSLYDVGSERIIYSLLNGKIAGSPNSSPVSSDLFFEVEDAFIHIDLKSVTTSDGIENNNIGDFNTSIFVGENQNTYKGVIIKNSGRNSEYSEKYVPHLPTFYTKKNGEKKITLTYFVSLLNNSTTKQCELVSIMSLPNGKLEEHYKSRPLKAGKNAGKARFNFKETPIFELLPDNKKRVRIIYKNPNMSNFVKKKLEYYLTNFDPKVEE
ncbi:hypothetical protein [Gemella sanguinis]|uniref:hypothetical protein n=1 Tax=Gemella sanguinis TaxID=84135 RepID=UPI0028EC61D1|nr:hypothetical protein [Gemella sanguinis]